MEPEKSSTDAAEPASPTPPTESATPAPVASAPPREDEADALETAEPTNGAGQPSLTANQTPVGPPPKKGGLKATIAKLNFYLILFIFILLLAGGIIMISYFQSKKAATNTTVKSQSLTQSTLSQLSNSDATVSDPKQVLNVESNAVFAGKVLIRNSLEVAGGIQVGGTLNLGDVVVSGDSNLGQVEISKTLAVAANAGIQGALTVGSSLQVNGSGTFNGPVSAPQLTTSDLQVNSDLTLTHHLILGGATPSHSAGPAVGSGGTSSVGGSDSAGLISVNTGSGAAAGCFITVSFATKYATTPYVELTPVGEAAGGLAYYVTTTADGFNVCDSSAPPAGASFGFNYFVVD